MRRNSRVTTRWPTKAAAVAALFPRGRLHPSVIEWAEGRQASARGPWAVAFSGGADSLALLLLLCAHWPERRARLLVLHFNHRLRGAAADTDERFCRSVCAALRVRLQVGRWKKRRAGASEEEARTARFAFFDRAMRRTGARALWLGHQQDDIAETMLMRLARGSGTGGLAAPRPVQHIRDQVRVRPLLTVKKQDVIKALRECGVCWREDRTNAGAAYFRNRVRHQVLPAWQKAAGRDAVAGAALARERLEEDDAALEAWLAELSPGRRGRVLNLAVLKGRPRALVRRALHGWLAALPLAAELSRQGFEDLLMVAMAGSNTCRSLGRDGFAVVRDGKMRFERVIARKMRVRKADRSRMRKTKVPGRLPSIR
jgi:tRNA(Ile)-lysidine synthase